MTNPDFCFRGSIALPSAFALRATRSAIGHRIARLTLEQIFGNSRQRLFPGGHELILRGIVIRILQHALALAAAFQRMLAQPERGLLYAFNRRDEIMRVSIAEDLSRQGQFG